MNDVVTTGGFIGFLADQRTIILALHALGVALGLGGATIADVLFFKFLKDLRISSKEAEVMRVLSSVILASLLLMFFSGVGLYLGDREAYNGSSGFLFKMIVVVVLSLNGFALHWMIGPKLIDISFGGEMHANDHLRMLRKIAFALGAVSIISWYSAFL